MPRDALHPMTVEQDTVVESPRTLAIRGAYDVVVCGGGPAGVGAALAAAKRGPEPC